MDKRILEYQQKLMNASPFECLAFFASAFKDKIVFSTSFGAEDQVLTDMISRLKLGIELFTLDTGRIFQETYDLFDITEKKYNLKIRIYFPEAKEVENMVAAKGINLFYESMENRKECCNIRKIEPLQRALSGNRVWITGLRKEQSVTRNKAEMIEWDENFQIIKLNPIIEWNETQVWAYIKEHRIPYNELHDKGYPSIGCQPCTRAVQQGENVRTGRWWWELPEFKECGLHRKP